MKTAKDAMMATNTETLPLLSKSEGLEEMDEKYRRTKNGHLVWHANSSRLIGKITTIIGTIVTNSVATSSTAILGCLLYFGLEIAVVVQLFFYTSMFAGLCALGTMMAGAYWGGWALVHKEEKKISATILANQLYKWASELGQAVDAYNFRAEEWNAYQMRLATNRHEQRDTDHDSVHEALERALELIQADQAAFEAELATYLVEKKRKRLERRGQIESIDLHDRIEGLDETERNSLARFSANREVSGEDALASGRQTAKLELVRDELSGKRHAGTANRSYAAS